MISLPSRAAPWAAALLLAVMAWPASAAGIYKCRQADGSTTFQQAPCAQGSQQTTVKPQQAPPPANPAAPAVVPPEAGSVKTVDAPQQCVQAGRAVFEQLGEHGQHPHAAALACKKQLGAQAELPCLQACLNTWVAQYKARGR